MFLIVGLGNPGERYRGTRHNIGREIVMSVEKKLGFPTFTKNATWDALVSAGKIGKERISLLLPETFMNKSGGAVAPALRSYKAKLRSVIVIHDDADMPLGATKLSFGKRSAGHKGVESIMRALGTRDFWRMRIGIQKKKRVPAEELVLQKFRANEEPMVRRVIKKSIAAIAAIAANGPEYAMNAYNH